MERVAASTRPSRAPVSRRQDPRVHVSLPVAVMRLDGQVVSGTVTDISLRGMRILTDRATAQSIQPSGRAPRAGEEPSEVRCAIALPCAHGDGKVLARCAIVHLSLVDTDTVAFGLEFLSLRAGGEENLNRFVEDALIPAY